ncbi:DUF6913 domain-containing protein [Polaribacter sargassicola]|uniref:DUF6913 domain-containing protein n=1 Tax=Polaribacter sargassicola TaxID=2836891 RepID=UPI001F33E5F3|nr:hypothetical protein [Polaribacter sp. DS7-9]MCG1036374.1 hypothetical protein [Polaribacter sp. DS7-9]
MSLFNIKELRLRKKFDKILSDKKEIFTDKEIKSIGIISLSTISESLKLEEEIASILGVKNIKIYSFCKDSKLKEDSFQYFSKKDINSKGNFINPNLQSFLEEPFDLLIGYFKEDNLYLKMAILQSRASFKVGFTGVDENLYRIEISEKTENLKSFSLELKKYLQLFKKLKN